MFSNSLGFLSCLLRHSENVLGIKLQRFSPFTLPQHSESSCAVVCCILAPDFEWQIRLPTPLTFPRSRLLGSFLCFSWLLSLMLQFFLNVLWCLMIDLLTGIVEDGSRQEKQSLKCGALSRMWIKANEVKFRCQPFLETVCPGLVFTRGDGL